MTVPVTVHVPILVEPIVKALTEKLLETDASAEDSWLVDCTLGGGGHAAALLAAVVSNPRVRLLGVDQDAVAIERARQRFAGEIAAGRMELLHARFSEIAPALEGRAVLGMMADLGFSSDQLEDRARGLSFLGDGPLDMRLDPSRGSPCSEVLRRLSEKELEEVFSEYGEERYSRRIAAAIKRELEAAPISTTGRLAEVISRAVPPDARHGRIHPATRCFQALRILVNDELNELDALLGHVILSVRPGGRVAFLSFHSLEDRKVKTALKLRGGPFQPLTKKPIEADERETQINPRSRSAKLRVAERVTPTDAA